jgi:hypothetical protein
MSSPSRAAACRRDAAASGNPWGSVGGEPCLAIMTAGAAASAPGGSLAAVRNMTPEPDGIGTTLAGARLGLAARRAGLQVLAWALALCPQWAWAIQTHGDPEGLYAHQMGHVLFWTAMVFVCVQIRRRGLKNQPGFSRLYWAAILFAVWNMLTFIGHFAEEKLDPGAISRGVGHLDRTLQITDLNGLIFYLAKLDHLVLVPAFWLLFRALQAFRRQQRGEVPQP